MLDTYTLYALITLISFVFSTLFIIKYEKIKLTEADLLYYELFRFKEHIFQYRTDKIFYDEFLDKFSSIINAFSNLRGGAQFLYSIVDEIMSNLTSLIPDVIKNNKNISLQLENAVDGILDTNTIKYDNLVDFKSNLSPITKHHVSHTTLEPKHSILDGLKKHKQIANMTLSVVMAIVIFFVMYYSDTEQIQYPIGISILSGIGIMTLLIRLRK